MKRIHKNRLLHGVVVGTLIASGAVAEVTSQRYRSSGDWFDTYPSSGGSNGWLDDYLPTAETICHFNWDNNTITLTNGTALVHGIQVARDEPSNLIVGDGGLLTTTNRSMVGFNNVGNMTVNTGGEVVFEETLWVAYHGSTGTLNINGGTVTVGGKLGIGGESGTWVDGVGSVFVNQGGTLYLDHLETNGVDSIKAGSKLDVVGTGQVIITGDASSVVQLYIANGTLLGNGSVSNLNVVVSNPGGGEITTLTALVAVPNVIGTDITAAMDSIINLGYTVGTITTNYTPYVISSAVTAQSPAGGATPPAGTPVDLEIQEPMPAESNAFWEYEGAAPDNDWMNPLNWGLGVVPVRETQNQRVITFQLRPIELSGTARVGLLVLADGGPPGQSLTLKPGAQLLAGKKGSGAVDQTFIGRQQEFTVTVQTNAIFKTFHFARLGLVGSNYEVHLNLDGGTFICDRWMTIGDAGKGITGRVTIDHGGLLDVDFINTIDPSTGPTNGVINVLDGTIVVNGNRTNFFNGAIANGFIVIGTGTTYTVDYNVSSFGRSTLTVVQPGYASWAKSWGVDIGSETNDFDNDMANNLLEYALNGNPTDSLDTGVAPVLENGAGEVRYIHLSRADDPNLVYTVQTRDDLVVGGWVDGGSTVIGTETGGDYNTVTNLVTPVKDASFLRLKVDNP